MQYQGRHDPRKRRGGTGFYLAWSQVSVAGGRNEPRAHLLFRGSWHFPHSLILSKLARRTSEGHGCWNVGLIRFCAPNRSPNAVIFEAMSLHGLGLEEIAAVEDHAFPQQPAHDFEIGIAKLLP